MADDFRDFDDDPFEETPDWLLDDDLVGSDLVETTADEDEFDQLRRKSARAGDLEDETTSEAATAEAGRSGSAFAWSNFTPGQRLVLALLIVLDIIAIVFVVLLFAGYI